MVTKFKTFPLTVTPEWLDEVEKKLKKHESKHEFIIKAVNKEMKLRKNKER